MPNQHRRPAVRPPRGTKAGAGLDADDPRGGHGYATSPGLASLRGVTAAGLGASLLPEVTTLQLLRGSARPRASASVAPTPRPEASLHPGHYGHSSLRAFHR